MITADPIAAFRAAMEAAGLRTTAPFNADGTLHRVHVDGDRAGEVSDGFTLRDVYRNCWSGLATPAEAGPAVELLEGLDWLRIEEEHTGGRPKVLHRINPRLEVAG